jgi:hypothetical protein
MSARQDPFIVNRFDVAMEPAPEEKPILTIGAVTIGGHPVALLLDPKDRAKVGGWLLPELVEEVSRLREERHSTNEALSDAAEQLRVQRDQIAELEATLKKYVGVEPTVADELAYVNRCLNAVYAVCDAAEKQAARWEHPLPVPEWVALVRNAADGVTVNAPALPPVPRQRQPEDPHESELHHTYELGRDLPTIPGQTTGRCPKGHTFEDCTCGGDR